MWSVEDNDVEAFSRQEADRMHEHLLTMRMDVDAEADSRCTQPASCMDDVEADSQQEAGCVHRDFPTMSIDDPDVEADSQQEAGSISNAFV